jgi:hypothetical protein
MSQNLNSAVAVIGIDIGKNSFHVVGQDDRGAIVLRQKWSRGQIEARLANLPPCLIGMEACVGAPSDWRSITMVALSPVASFSRTFSSFSGPVSHFVPRRGRPQSVRTLYRFWQRIREEALNRGSLVCALAAQTGVEIAALFKLVELSLGHQNRPPKEAMLAAPAMPENRLADSAEAKLAASTWKGVATWSKVLAIRNPGKYPIYDARVGAALVALQLLKEPTNPFLFAQVTSRNNVIRDFQRRIKEAGGSKGQTYPDYVALLTAVAEKAKLDSPEEIEMVLFYDRPPAA